MTRTKDDPASRTKRSFMRYLFVTNPSRLESGRPVFPLTVDDLLEYINFRSKTSTFRTIQWYIRSLHHDPLHGPHWRQQVFFHPRVVELLESLRRRDRMTSPSPCSAKKKPAKKSAEEVRAAPPPVPDASGKPTAPLAQPVSMTPREPVSLVQQESTASVTAPSAQDPALSYAVDLSLTRLQRRVCLVNDPLPVTWS
ncbi:hypothetical protein BX666DRAFT_2022132 [Dichotomocladium elegans]|nr:hypothetical protein BX666DRAFT_2022132 [Dichotomocladium elegans]